MHVFYNVRTESHILLTLFLKCNVRCSLACIPVAWPIPSALFFVCKRSQTFYSVSVVEISPCAYLSISQHEASNDTVAAI